MRSPPNASSVGEIVGLYERWGAHRYDEEVTQLAHALQCADLAVDAGASDELIAAALLHDVGHLLELQQGHDGTPMTDLGHEHVGATYLSSVFGESVTSPIELHVEAKRYLCAIDPAYGVGLSHGSTASLALQGGPLGPDAVAEFECRHRHTEAAALRRWDDLGKRNDRTPAGLSGYIGLLQRVASDLA